MNVLFAGQDLGGSEAILPVALALKKNQNNKIVCFMESLGKKLFIKNNLSCEDLEFLRDSQIHEKIVSFKPDIIVTGTSLGLTIDKKIIKHAKKLSIKSLSIIDYWANYKKRFLKTGDGTFYLPDFICVIDDFMKQEMIDEGFDGKKLKVTGNPHFDEFAEKNHNSLKNQLLFIEQPMFDLKKFGLEVGYDEVEVLSDILEILKFINSKNKKKCYLLLRIHPRSNKNRFLPLLKKFPDLIILDKNKNLSESISKSRIVLGMSSVGLFQAFLGGVEVMSYQPNISSKTDASILNKLGVVKSIYSKGELKSKLIDTLASKNYVFKKHDMFKKYVENNSTEKIIKLISQIVST